MTCIYIGIMLFIAFVGVALTPARVVAQYNPFAIVSQKWEQQKLSDRKQVLIHREADLAGRREQLRGEWQAYYRDEASFNARYRGYIVVPDEVERRHLAPQQPVYLEVQPKAIMLPFYPNAAPRADILKPVVTPHNPAQPDADTKPTAAPPCQENIADDQPGAGSPPDPIHYRGPRIYPRRPGEPQQVMPSQNIEVPDRVLVLPTTELPNGTILGSLKRSRSGLWLPAHDSLTDSFGSKAMRRAG
jgi:hypothetical protein